MDFSVDNTHKMLRDMYRDFATREVEPLAATIDEEERPPYENIPKMRDAGLFGIPISKENGGEGGDYLGYVMAVEEISKACASSGVIISAHTSLCAWPIETYGTEEQKEKYLKKLASGEHIGAFALTEPMAGTDASMQQTTAHLTEDGKSYILNGSKIFITNATLADTFIIIAMTDKSQGTHGISAFIVEKDTPGFTVGLPEKKMGIHGSLTCELIFEDCKIPAENLLGKEGKGFKIAMTTLDGGRIGVAAQALGIAQGALDKTIEYVKEREQFGRPLAKFQNTQFQLANLANQIEAARLLVYKAADDKDCGRPYSVSAAHAKLFAAETAMNVTTKCVQLYGGYGYTRDYPVERMMRDAKITEIYEGTSEVQRMVISGSLFR